MSAIRLGAASMAYRSFNFNKDRRAVPNTIEEARIHAEIPAWLTQFAAQLPENEVDTPVEISEPTYRKKERLYADSKYGYERLAWFIYANITSTAWFEGFIMLAILLIAINTGLELEIEGEPGHHHQMDHFFHLTSKVTLGIFIMECSLKIIAEGFEPWNFFLDKENGGYNTFDFVIVVMSLVFAKSTGSTIGAFRMLKLVRLLTFIKNVPQLRMILAGLIHGVKSVSYVIILLSLVLYIFAILGCILFGENDPNHFGGVGIAMLTLFHVSTLASWTDVAYISWFGCKDYVAGPYSDSNPEGRIKTMAGDFQGYACITNKASPTATGLFFAVYIVFTGWVIMSIFIGVISMGMFDSYLSLKEEMHASKYIKRLAENTMREAVVKKNGKHKSSLKRKIEVALCDSSAGLFKQSSVASSSNQDDETPNNLFEKYVAFCNKVTNSDIFVGMITCTILLVGVFSGVDTNGTLHCGRLKITANHLSDEVGINDNLQHKLNKCEHTAFYLTAIFFYAQIMFTVECVLKIGAEGYEPMNYFLDMEAGSWNRLDFCIVLVGFFELSHIQVGFPVFALRLVRLVRVLRLAKAFPKLRAIVEALMSSFANVGWICVMIFTFNYIVGCLCIVFFRSNDPFHFGSVGRAMFTVLRIETLDKWDQILYIAMYGCEGYPSGYEFLDPDRHSSCESNHAAGYLGALVVYVIAFIGAYVLPTVLIGIVSIKFDNATKAMKLSNQEKTTYNRHLEIAQKALPEYFTADRLAALKTLFDTLDSNSEKMLDLNELSPFLQYAMDYMFDIELMPHQVESLFYLCDTGDRTEIGLGEFITLISILKQMHLQMKKDPSYATQIFDRAGLLIKKRLSFTGKSKWDNAMDRVDKESLDTAWLAFLRIIKATPGASLHQKIQAVFQQIDSDSSGEIDCSELGISLKACGINLNDRELLALIHVVDRDGNGSISLYEFITQIETIIRNHDEFKSLMDDDQYSEALKKKSRTPSIAGGNKLVGIGDLTTTLGQSSLDGKDWVVSDAVIDDGMVNTKSGGGGVDPRSSIQSIRDQGIVHNESGTTAEGGTSEEERDESASRDRSSSLTKTDQSKCQLGDKQGKYNNDTKYNIDIHWEAKDGEKEDIAGHCVLTPAQRVAVSAGFPVLNSDVTMEEEEAAYSTMTSSAASSIRENSKGREKEKQRIHSSHHFKTGPISPLRCSQTPPTLLDRQLSIDKLPPNTPSCCEEPTRSPRNMSEALAMIELLRRENEMLKKQTNDDKLPSNIVCSRKTFTPEMLHDWMSQGNYKHSADNVNGVLRKMSEDDAKSIGQKI